LTEEEKIHLRKQKQLMKKVVTEEEKTRRREVREAKNAATSKLMFDWANNQN
jgi:hypothetical protein